MSRRRCAVLLSALLAILSGAGVAHAQAPTGSISGQVVDSASRAAVAGAQVMIVGTGRGSAVRDDGSFLIGGVPAGAQRLRVSRIGYTAREIPVTVTEGQVTTVRVAMHHTAVQLSEMVVVGYGTQRREDVTGSVSSIPAEQLQKTVLNSVEQGLQGQVAGVQVTQGDAAPGGGIRVQIRGVNSMNSGSAQPLYVIDGVPVASSGTTQQQLGATGTNSASLATTNPLATIAPEDIESIDILKDASATAIYGSRGANGVVMITTKRGHRGQPSQLSLTYSQGYSSVTKQLDVLTAPQYATYVNQSFAQGYGTQPIDYPYGGQRNVRMAPDSIARKFGNGINWQDRIFRTGVVREGQLNFTGGDDKGSYLVSGNLLDQGGVINGSAFRRGGIRSNLDRQINSRVKMQSNLSVTRSNNNMVRTATSTSYLMQGIVRLAITYTPLKNINGDTAWINGDPRAVDNETFLRYGATPDRYTDEVREGEGTTRGLGNVKVVTDLGGGFSLDLGVAGNYENKDFSSYLPRTIPEAYNTNGDAVRSGSEFTNIISDNLLRFQRSFGSAHRVDAVGGFSYENNRSYWNRQEVKNFSNDILGANALQLGSDVVNPVTALSTWKLASWLGRVNYTLADRYIFTGTVRTDGSSKFAKNNKWATFTSGAFAWRAIEEGFVKNHTPFSDLKLRLSYGESGNQGIGPYQSLAQVVGGVTSTGVEYHIGSLANPNLKWETTAQSDAGLDFGFFRQRFTGSVDVYQKMTRDLLQFITVSPNTSFGGTWINSGNVKNWGQELQLGYDIMTGGTHRPTWNITANASRNRNKIASLGNGNTVQFAQDIGYGAQTMPFIQKPGLPIGAIWGYVVDGIQKDSTKAAMDAIKAKQPDARWGGYLYKDLSGPNGKPDGKIDDYDRTLIGNANPDWTWGVSNRLTYNRFDFSFLFTGVRGGNIINADRLRYLELNGYRNLPKYYVDRAWDPNDPNNPNRIYAMADNGRGGVRFSNYILEDASYVRLKNLQLGYNVPERYVRGLQNARFYVNALNVLTWTKYTGFDPEVSAFGGTDRPGVDLGSYPNNRTVTLGLSTTF